LTYNEGMSDQATAELNAIMENAAQALAAMDYIQCEALCLRALAQARQGKDWAEYGRILMPLQECRRQRRMIAADGVIRLGTADLEGEPGQWLERISCGCVVVTHPHAPADAALLHEGARKRKHYIEVLYVDSQSTDARWTIRSHDGPDVVCEVDAPPDNWRDCWIDEPGNGEISKTATPGDWFIDATEQLGDAAMAGLAGLETEQNEPASDVLIAQLEACLRVVPDHELLHQRLSEVVQQVRMAERCIKTEPRP